MLWGEAAAGGDSSTAGQSLKDFSFHALNEEITQNPEVSMVYKFGWPDWRGKISGGKSCAQSY